MSKSSSLSWLIVGIAIGVFSQSEALRQLALPWLKRAQPDPAAEGSGELVEIGKRILNRPSVSKVIYLNREGAALRGGPDDSTFNISSIVGRSANNHAEVPPFAGTAARWNQISKCIRSKFTAFDVHVVEQRPVQGDYVMAVLGGHPDNLALNPEDEHRHSHATGLAPFSSEPIPRAVVFVFTRALKEDARASCEVAGMEIAHAFGLDHARNCKDLMTYMKPCGLRAFIDKDLPCGELEDRACANGDPTQNSYRALLSVLGAKAEP